MLGTRGSRSRFRCSVVLMVLLVVSSCQRNVADNSGAKERAARTSEAQKDGYTVDNIDRQISIRMAGADNADFKGTARLRIQIPTKDAPLNIMVVGTTGYLDVGGGVKLSIGILLAELYKGDGNYTLPANTAPSPGSTPNPNNPASLASNSRVTFYADNTSGPERTLRAYDTLTKPCPIVIGEGGKSGEVHCPQIRSVELTSVSFDMTWGE